ncbi:2OG-Fe(II) oxygenase [Allosphingosinicella deserti]|uniref:Proline hydroxylase n=1 Tax=Allosphingosinicella deserti TaxID=2116704 RepID=A0A2P7QKF7_9SPHN|nr:2OG-Fe(II) oxygenase [Sphingomonas deserti]PSJ38420.1 proline hydroxylase [Sphingomonas deserti]
MPSSNADAAETGVNLRGRTEHTTRAQPSGTASAPIAARLLALDWNRIARDLDGQGWATTGPLLTPEECERLAALYDSDAPFRSRVVMARHGFGQGEYRYFAYPLPDTVAALRRHLYARLVPTAESWRERLGQAGTDAYPADHEDYLGRCHAAGQMRPTPLLLRYGPGDYNCLHQDLYGELAFPLQAAFLLSEPGRGFEGGEFVLTEQRPRMQSRVHVVPLQQGEAAIFAVNQRPVQGARGSYRVIMRHGVSPLRAGRRHTLGIIFHDAA